MVGPEALGAAGARTAVDCPFDFAMELSSEPGGTGLLLHREEISCDLPHLVDETFTRGVLEEVLPVEPEEVRVAIRPVFETEPKVDAIEVVLQVPEVNDGVGYSQSYRVGRWIPRSSGIAQGLRDEGTLGEGVNTYPVLLAERRRVGPRGDGGDVELRLPLLRGPVIVDQTLEEFGVRQLGDGALVPDRPVLVNARMIEEVVQATRAAGPNETGGAVLGKLIRLPEPLPGTRTRVVTILAMFVPDARHLGRPGQFTFSTDALAYAAEIASMREAGEVVLTALHTHGWGTGCERCNDNAGCVLPQAREVSVQDYSMLESMFPCKSALMPIAGRVLGASGNDPVLEVHAWRGGVMRAIRWRKYDD